MNRHHETESIISPLGCIVLLIVLLFVVFASQPAAAQPPVTTQFLFGCATAEGVELGYWSDGDSVWAVTTETDGIPTTIETTAGLHEGVWVVTGGAHLVISNDYEVHTFDVYGVACESVGTQTPEPDVQPTLTPQVDHCPAWSLESATGNMICLWELPRVGEWM